MKNKILGILLTLMIVFILFVIISSYITINNYDNISRTIDSKITSKKIEIKEKKNEYKKLKEENTVKQNQLDNMDEYINTLNEKVKEYEK